MIEQMPRTEGVGGTVSSALSATVSGKVLEGGGHMIRIDGTVGGSLQTSHHRFSQLGNKEGIFPKCFVHPSPAQVPGNIEDRGKDMGDTAGTGLAPRLVVNLLHQIRVPGTGNSDGGGKGIGLEAHEAMSRLIVLDRGDSQTGAVPEIFLHRGILFEVFLDGEVVQGPKLADAVGAFFSVKGRVVDAAFPTKLFLIRVPPSGELGNLFL